MFFNFDSFEIISIAFVVSGIFIYSYNSATLNNESLVNTSKALNSDLSRLDLSNNLINNSTSQLMDIGVQTDTDILVETGIQTANTYVNTGMQTSARMWLESIRNWINEILGSSTPNPGYVDAGVQTMGPVTSMWSTVKQWFLEVCSIRSSELSSLGHKKVNKWRNKLASNQSVDLQDSESSLTNLRFETESNLQQLVNPDDSASNISEIVSLSNLQDVVSEANRVYDMSNRQDVLDLFNDPTVLFGINGAYDPADDLITFITPDSSYEIVRSTLDALLNSVN